MIKLAPSVLAADFSRLGEQVKATEKAGADWIHVDVMDGRFVPSISFGFPILAALRSMTSLTLDVHLMIEDPDPYLAEFARLGADRITVHVETCPHLHRTVQQIEELGCRSGVALNPATPLFSLEEILPELDLVLIMSVNPGFGGQSYIPASTGKISRLRSWLDRIGSEAELEVDGGLNVDTISTVAEAGATVLVAGTAILNDQSTISDNIQQLRSLCPPT